MNIEYMATYTVKPGDTLSKIAQKYNISWKDLYNQNKNVIGSNPNLIYSGQKYNIPGSSTSTSSNAGSTQSVSDGTELGTSIGEKNKVTPFEDVLSFDQYFDKNLATSSAEQTAAEYYAPLVRQARNTLESDYANRGLTRSGQRGAGISTLYGDYASQHQSDIEQDMAQMEAEALEEYNILQQLYEESGGTNAPNAEDYQSYDYTAPTLIDPTRAGEVGMYPSPADYGQRYLDWITAGLHPKTGQDKKDGGSLKDMYDDYKGREDQDLWIGPWDLRKYIGTPIA